MSQLLTYVLLGLPYGCIYALIALGLVLTYKSSRVFNLAFGAQAYVSAVVFYVAVRSGHWPIWAAGLVSIVVVGPLLGLLLDRLLFRHIRVAATVVKLGAAIGLLLGIPEITQVIVGTQPQDNPPSLFLPPSWVFKLAGTRVNGTEVSTVLAAAIVVVGLWVLFRFSTLGLEMRAVSESPRMVELVGVNSGEVSSVAWMLSSLLAGLAGVLLAPLFATLDSYNFTLLLIAAIAAAALGGLASFPWTVLGAVAIGVAQEVMTGYLPLNSVLASGLRPALPFVVLILALLFHPGLRSSQDEGDPLASCDPPPLRAVPVKAHREHLIDLSLPSLFTPLVVALAIGSCLTWVPQIWVGVITVGLTYATILLSLTVLTGMGGQISLCQATFAGIGAFAAGQLATHLGLGFIEGLAIGAVLAGVLGLLLALPALRLGGLALALGTLAFALLADNLLFPLSWVGNGQSGVYVPRPQIGPISFAGTRSFFLLVLAVLVICGVAIALLRKGTTGRFLAAMGGSEVAAGAIGINVHWAKMTAFVVSAVIAGIGGAMYGSYQGAVGADNFNTLISLLYLVLVVTFGVKTVAGAVNAGLAYAVLDHLLASAPSRFGGLAALLFGMGAVAFALHPQGLADLFTARWKDQLDRLRHPWHGRETVEVS
ncbi:MAG: ABC transporter permease [Actinobacteria bacterium]|nr:ABC transporter permease [Actinomycetota bacterium]